MHHEIFSNLIAGAKGIIAQTNDGNPFGTEYSLDHLYFSFHRCLACAFSQALYRCRIFPGQEQQRTKLKAIHPWQEIITKFWEWPRRHPLTRSSGLIANLCANIIRM